MRGFILVLDEDNDVVTAISESLRKQGLNAHAFTDPVAALEYLKTNFKDCALVIIDIRMPRMNGFQFVRMARELRLYGLIKKPILMRKLEALIKNSTTATAMKRKNEESDRSRVLGGTSCA